MSNIAPTASSAALPDFPADTSIFRSVILSEAKAPYTAQISRHGFKFFCSRPILLAPLSQEAPATIEVNL